MRGEHVVAAAASPAIATRSTYSEAFAWWVGLGLANVVNALDPEVVVIGGGLVEVGDLLLDPVRRA